MKGREDQPLVAKSFKQVGVLPHDIEAVDLLESSGDDSVSSCCTCGCQSVLVFTGTFCCCMMFLVAIVAVALTFFTNALGKKAIAVVGTALLGVDVSVQDVSFGILHGRSSFTQLKVASPAGFGTQDFIDLKEGVFDIRLLSLIFQPVEFQELSLRNLRMRVDQQPTLDTNVRYIIGHINQVLDKLSPGRRDMNEGINYLTTRIIADKIDFEDVRPSFCVHPACPIVPAMEFHIKKVRVRGVGKRRNGVYLYELIEIIFQALVAAALHAAPHSFADDIFSTVKGHLSKSLDYQALEYDVGEGLKKIGALARSQLDRLEGQSKSAKSVVEGEVMRDTQILGNMFERAVGVEGSTNPTAQKIEQTMNHAVRQFGTVMGHAAGAKAERFGHGLSAFEGNLSSVLTNVGRIIEVR